MRATVTWPPLPDETDGDLVDATRAQGFDNVDGGLPAGVDASIGSAGYGKGASGNGVALVLEIAEHTINDLASLIALGVALKSVVRRITSARRREPVDADAGALSAIAAAHSDRLRADPSRWGHARTVPLTTDGSVGTDMRDVWAATFVDFQIGLTEVVFLSSTTRYLGTATVASEWLAGLDGGRVRSDAELEGSLAASFVN
jgi:hypothetical protein